jgi:hypothetical protein
MNFITDVVMADTVGGLIEGLEVAPPALQQGLNLSFRGFIAGAGYAFDQCLEVSIHKEITR